VLHQLGAGTLGPVFRAHDPAEGRLVAIKVFRLDLTPEAAFAFARELQGLVDRELSHPSIAAPLAAGLEGATPWLAQTYVPAESLDTALRQFGPAPAVHVVTIVTHLAGALDFAAAAGVLHGSLHPRDVLVSPDAASLIDLGVAQALEACGLRTPIRRPYSSLERIAGGAVSHAADVFALAAIAYELLLGQPITATDEAAGESLPEIPGADLDTMKPLFASALATEPARRPDSALAFASAFKAALGTAAFRSSPAVPSRRSRRVTPSPTLPLDVPVALPIAATPVHDAPSDEPPVAHPAVPQIEPPEPSTPQPSPARQPVSSRPAPSPFADATPPTTADVPPARPSVKEHVEDLPIRLPSPPSREHSLDVAPGVVVRRPPTRRPPGIPALALLILLGVVAGLGLGWLWLRGGGDEARSVDSDIATPTTGVDQIDEGLPADKMGAPPQEPAAVAGETAPDEASGPAATSLEEAPPVEASPGPVQTPAPRRPTAAPSPRGTLTVRSTPPGASVEVNGRGEGRTPLSLRNIPLGGHSVVLTRPGYQPERRRVTLSPNRAVQTLSVPMRRAERSESAGGSVPARPDTFVGTMLVESRPVGARVFLDGREVGRTPMVLSDVRAGSHVVRLELDGYRTWTASARVVAGERLRVAASLEEFTR
jgi:serine/threonine protein kinase